jgi:hypothetical protein
MDIELIYTEATEGSHMDGGDGVGRGVHPSAYCGNTPPLSILVSELEVHVASDGYHVIIMAGLISQSPASGAGNPNEPRLLSQVSRVREGVCAHISVYSTGAVQVLVFVWIHSSSSSHVTEVGGP